MQQFRGKKNSWSTSEFSCRKATHLVSCASWNSSERLLSSAVLISCLSCFSEHLRRSTSCVRLFRSLWASTRLLDSCSPCIRRFFTWRDRWDVSDARHANDVFDIADFQKGPQWEGLLTSSSSLSFCFISCSIFCTDCLRSNSNIEHCFSTSTTRLSARIRAPFSSDTFCWTAGVRWWQKKTVNTFF